MSEKKNRLIKWIYIFLGSISLITGIIGIFLPILPTTPFLLVTAFCYSRSSKKYYNLLMNNKLFGKYLSDYKQKKVIPLKIKIITISVLWISIISTASFLVEIFLIKISLIIIAAFITFHILRLRQKNY